MKTLWDTASAFKVTFHVRDRRWCNRVGLTFGIRPMLAGTQTSFLLDILMWAVTFTFGAPCSSSVHWLAVKQAPSTKATCGAPERLLVHFKRVTLAAEMNFLEHHVHVNSPSISSCSRGLCIYFGVSGLDLQPWEPLAPALSKFKTLTFTQHPGHFPQ